MVCRAGDPALAGAYNLPDGRPPVVDGQPRWPWDDEIAHRRLVRLASRLGIRLSGDESRLDGASNDTWCLGDQVLRICWRGDLDRMSREAEVLAALPDSVPRPRPVDWGRDDRLSWMLLPRVRGSTLAEVWPTTPRPRLRAHVDQLAEHLATLHIWTPPPRLCALLDAGAATEADEALTIVGRQLVPLSLSQQLRLIEYVRAMPFVPGELLDGIAERLTEEQSRLALDRLPRVFVHADATPSNVIVRDGRIVALLDFEWSCLAPVDVELVLPRFWCRCQPEKAKAEVFHDWLRTASQPPSADAETERRGWLYLAAFALRCCACWPPDRPESDLYPDHPVLLLRELLDRSGGR